MNAFGKMLAAGYVTEERLRLSLIDEGVSFSLVFGFMIPITMALSGCSSGLKAPHGEPVAFPIDVSDGDELLLECYKGSEKAVIPLGVPESVKRAESIVYFVNEEWRCEITRMNKPKG